MPVFNFATPDLLLIHGWIQKGGQGVGTPPGNSQIYIFFYFSNTGPDPLENDKATKPAFIVRLLQWHFADGPMMASF